MERLMEDALHVRNLLPWIESDEEIIHFMRRIPLDKSHLRNQLALRYFIQRNDYDDNFEQNIEDDAREIIAVLPDTPYKEVKERLSILGNIANRKEVVIRHLLHKKWDLDGIINDIDVNVIRKRKSETSENLFDLDSTNSQTNIKIKIRKVEGSLEVVSQITQEGASPRKAGPHMSQAANEPTSSTSITSSSNYSEPCNSSINLEVPSTSTAEIEDPCPEFTSILNKLIEKNKPSTSGTMLPVIDRVKPAPMISENNNVIDFATTSYNIDVPETEQTKEDNVTSATTELKDIPNNSTANETFNLITFIKEMSAASEKRIRRRCKELNISLNERPSPYQLNLLLNDLLDDVIEVASDSDLVSSEISDSDTEEYQFNDNLPNYMEIDGNQQGTHIIQNEPTTLNPNAKEFKLKSPVLNLDCMTPTSSTNGPLPKLKIIPPAASPNKRLLIQPPRLTLPDQRQPIEQYIYKKPAATRVGPPEPGTEVNVFPAMPDLFKELLESRISKERERQDLHGTNINTAFVITPNPNSKLPEAKESSNTTNDAAGSSVTVLDSPIDYSPSVAIPGTSTASGCSSNASASSSNASGSKLVVDEKLFLRLVEMFPEACPDFLRQVCAGRKWSEFDEVVTVILSVDYPKRPQRAPSPTKEVDLEEQYEIIKELLPDADPVYLRMQCEKYINNDKGLKNFIDSAMEQKDYPTMKDYLRKQQISAQQKQYTTNFNIENFVQLIPDPLKTFNDPKRNINMDDTYSRHYITLFFRNKFDKIPARHIQSVLSQNNYKVMSSNNKFLEMIAKKDVMKSRRKPVTLPENLQNIPLLQELAYLTHKDEIEAYIQEKQKREEQDRLEAKKNGLMQTCQCCYDDEVMPKDTFNCPNGCMFCKDCIKKSCEVALGEGKTNFPCLADCSTEYSLQTLQTVLPPKMFSKLAQKKALAEIKAAGIEELETCPFCDFASIPNEGDRIFRCLNPDCMKESCRSCKEPNHVPLKCEEVEKDQDVQARTYIEDKMTEALIRKCWKCGLSFFKEEGCNKMTCSCGAQMCYLCKQPVKDYTHFNGIGGDKFHLCPLYSDTNLINQENVINAAKAAKAEIDPTKLKVDPTVDIADHYKTRAKKLPREPHMDLLNLNHLIPHVNRHGHHHHHRHGPMHPRQIRRLVNNRWIVENMNRNN